MQTFAQSLAQWGPYAPVHRSLTIVEAREYCRKLAHSHYENFTVVSWLLPKRLRQDFCNLYAYCRWADDLADETNSPEQSSILLDWWEQQLLACYEPSALALRHPVFIALDDTIRNYQMPVEPFRDLISAFRQDQRVTSYESPEEVFDYCTRSANPVGRMILYLARTVDSESLRLSDHVCTGLQLANFCQDVANDWDRGRIYLPQSTLRATGYTQEHFQRREFNAAFRCTMEIEVDRAEAHLQAGRSLVERIPKDLRFDVSLFIAGGLAVLNQIRRQNFDVWKKRPRLKKWQKFSIAAKQWCRIHSPSPFSERELQASYKLCKKIAKHSASNFAWAFWLLPNEKRSAMYALYAFLRHTDDLGDNALPADQRRLSLRQWRTSLLDALAGKKCDGIFPAVADMMRRFSVPAEDLTDVVDGVLMDCIEPDPSQSRFATFAELERYCELVASAVGRACIRIWGFSNVAALEPARSCGVALQLTNILRDLKQDASEGRIYLPAEDFTATGYTIDELRRGTRNERFIELMRLEISRAEIYYQQAQELHQYLDTTGQKICGAMVDTYRGLLNSIKRDEAVVLDRRIRLGKFRKLTIALQWLLNSRLLRRSSKGARNSSGVVL